MEKEGSEMVSLFFALLPDWKIISAVYTDMYLTGACKNSRVYKYPPRRAVVVFLWLVKSTPSPFKCILLKK